MRERPILFSAPMVRAILDGRKTVTRRIVKPQPDLIMQDIGGKPLVGKYTPADMRLGRLAKAMHCPYGQPGDRLWVRETFSVCTDGETVSYRATDSNLSSYQWKPSIHMPRWASRITLEVTDVRVERLQDITEDQARAEGCEPGEATDGSPSYVLGFMDLWESINGAGSWDANPWVWAVEFKRIDEAVSRG